MSERDIDELFRKFSILDAELKQLRVEVGEIKWYQQHGTKGAVAYLGDQIMTSMTLPIAKVAYSSQNKPAQWPNEPYTDYLKRIGEYNEAMIYEDDTK